LAIKTLPKSLHFQIFIILFRFIAPSFANKEKRAARWCHLHFDVHRLKLLATQTCFVFEVHSSKLPYLFLSFLVYCQICHFG
jgi:hypothetical protein